jgi:hypothetical protein
MATKTKCWALPAVPFLRVISTLLFELLACSGASACASTTADTPTPAAPPAFDEHLAEVLGDERTPCEDRTPPNPGQAAFAVPQVFVESLLVEIPAGSEWQDGGADLDTLARVPGARLQGTPRVIAHFDDTATLTLGTRYLPLGTQGAQAMFFKSITVHPSLGDSGVLLLEFDVVLEVPAPSADPSQPPYRDVHVSNTFALRERQAATLRASVPEYSRADLVIHVVPYVIRSQADLRDLFQCKVRRRAKRLGLLREPDLYTALPGSARADRHPRLSAKQGAIRLGPRSDDPLKRL